MKTFSIRIEEDLFDKIEATRENKPRTDFIREVIEGYFLNLPSPNLNLSSPELNLSSSGILEAKIKNLEDIIKAKDQTIKILEEDKGFIISEYQRERSLNERLLMPSQEERKDKPRWFEFWKR